MEKNEPSMVIGSWSLGDDLWEEEREQPSHHQSPTEPLPSLLRHATNDDKRILLQSPTNADSSSLILDLALSLASDQPCRCRTNDCEGCVAVCVLVLGNNDSPPFPKLCRPHVATNVAPPRGSDKVDSNYEPDHTQKQLLHRIQIRHVHTLQDILRYGLSLTGLPQEEVPMGGILVDGCLDRLVAASNAAHVAMQITQIVAVLSDTASCLQSRHQTVPTVLVSVSDQPKNQLLLTACQFWDPQTVTISQQQEHKVSHPHNHDEVGLNSWLVNDAAAYSILQNLNQEQRIVWSTQG